MNNESRKDLKKKNNLKGVFGLEVTTTQSCNFKCTYCFEQCHIPTKIELTSDIVIKRVNELLNTDWFKDQYSGIKIILWGGEPTLNMSMCIDLMEEFMDEDRVCFFIYTNGSTIEEILPTLKQLKEKKFIKEDLSKVTVQVSYDGNPLHDRNRRDSQGNPTSNMIIQGLKKLHKYGIDYGLKSTVSWKDFKHLPKCYNDLKFLHSVFGSKIKYSLTVDYYNVRFSEFSEEVEEALIKIAQKEIKFIKKYGYFLSNIFRNNMSICATGKSMCVINTNGDVYNCHGAMYSKCSDDLQYSNIFDENFINKLREANIRYENNHIVPEKCEECIATSCLRCNVKKYEESDKETHLDKWYDYPAQTDLCNYYQIVGKIGNAIGSIIEKGE